MKAGDVLARLDDNDLRASVGELEARAKYAEQQFERAGLLLKQGWATKEKFDQARSDMDAARQAARRAGELLTFMQLRTPTDGLIIRRTARWAIIFPVNQPVFYLAKAGVPLRISADVDEEDIPLVKVGQKVLIRSDAFPSRFHRHGVRDHPKGDPIARSYRVRVELPADTGFDDRHDSRDQYRDSRKARRASGPRFGGFGNRGLGCPGRQAHPRAGANRDQRPRQDRNLPPA